MSGYNAKHLNDTKTRRNKPSVKNTTQNTAKENDSGDLYSFVQCILESVTAAFLLLVFCVNVSVVAGSSMNPTLQDGDRILVAHTGYTLWYGDVVAVWAANLNNRETGEMGELIVKRVIGLPGDVIYIDDSGRVYRNGLMLKEDYIMPFDVYENKGNAAFPLTVEENCVFLLGDNRNHSTDSRFVDTGGSEFYVGCIDQRYIMGKAVYCLYPFDRMGVVK